MKKLIIALLMVAGIAQATLVEDLVRRDDVVTTVKDYGATGDGVTDDAAAINTALSAINSAGGGSLIIPDGTYVISIPLIIYDDTTLLCDAGAVIELKAGSDTNMIQNEFAISLAGRNKNITINGGIWNRGSNNGIGNGKHSMFLRQIDNVHVENLTYNSLNGKYGIAFGGVNNFYAENITFDCFSDGIHIDGPATNGWIKHLRGDTGDDVVGITTKSYAIYDDMDGSIDRVTIQDIDAVSYARAVLIMGSAAGAPDGNSITHISVSDVTFTKKSGGGQIAVLCRGIGNGTTEVMDQISISRIRGGVVSVEHPNAKNITIDDIDCPNAYGEPFAIKISSADPDGTNSIVSIENLTIKNCHIDNRLLTTAVTNFVFGTFIIEDSSFEGMKLIPGSVNTCSIGKILIRNCAITNASEQLLEVQNLPIDSFIIENSSLTCASTSPGILVDGTCVIDRLHFSDSILTGGSSTSATGAIVSEAAATGKVNNFYVNNCLVKNGFGLLYRGNSTALGSKTLNISDTIFTNTLRVAYCLAVDLDFKYSNVDINTTSESLWVGTAGSLLVTGNGWIQGASAAVRVSVGPTLRVRSWDLPVDPDTLTPSAGDYVLNTDAAIGGGVGPCVYSGSAWSRLY
jgi:hypothetical protein